MKWNRQKPFGAEPLKADRIEGEYKLLLYQIDAFYVEVW